MKIYIIRNPFMCHEGEFTEGKRDLCVGIEKTGFDFAKDIRIYLGDNRSTYYDLNIKTLQELYKQIGGPKMFNRGKVQIYILPLFICTQFKVKFDKEAYYKKEKERDKTIQESLF